jgi:hypothetical protein
MIDGDLFLQLSSQHRAEINAKLAFDSVKDLSV